MRRANLRNSRASLHRFSHPSVLVGTQVLKGAEHREWWSQSHDLRPPSLDFRQRPHAVLLPPAAPACPQVERQVSGDGLLVLAVQDPRW
eukprot:6261345-Pyramimonas_sp.AAC.2